MCGVFIRGQKRLPIDIELSNEYASHYYYHRKKSPITEHLHWAGTAISMHYLIKSSQQPCKVGAMIIQIYRREAWGLREPIEVTQLAQS